MQPFSNPLTICFSLFECHKKLSPFLLAILIHCNHPLFRHAGEINSLLGWIDVGLDDMDARAFPVRGDGRALEDVAIEGTRLGSNGDDFTIAHRRELNRRTGASAAGIDIGFAGYL